MTAILMEPAMDISGNRDNPETESWNTPGFHESAGDVVYASNSPHSQWITSSEVVSYGGGMLRVRQHLMVIGTPYAFVFEGVPVVAIKRLTGEVDFFYLPTE